MKLTFDPIKCAICGEVTERTTGVQKYCKQCSKIADKERHHKWAVENPERNREHKRRWKLNNIEAVREAQIVYNANHREQTKRWIKEHIELVREYKRQYKLRNKELVRKQNGEYRERHAEYITQYNREYYQKNKIRRYQYYIDNRERVRDYLREYYHRTKDTRRDQLLMHVHNYQARKRGNGGGYTVDEIRALWDNQDGICPYCNELIYSTLDKERHIEHVIPVSRGAPNSIDNIVLACSRCNLEKKDKTAEEYLRWKELIK